MNIRELNKSDLDGLVDVYKEHWPITEISSLTFDKVIENDNIVFVAEEDNQIIGSLILHLQHKFIRDGSTASFIEDVIVRKKYRGRGIGELLVSSAIDKSRELGCYKVVLQCSDDNIKFYEKCGLKKFNYNIMGLGL